MKFLHSVLSLALLCGTHLAVAAPPGELGEWGKAIDPDKDCQFNVEKNQLTIRVPGSAHDLSAELGIMNGPRVLQEIEGDFIIQVKLGGDIKLGDPLVPGRAPYQGAGLILMKDDNTYIRMERGALPGFFGKSVYGNFELRVNGQIERFGTTGDAELEDKKATMLRLERRGNKVLGAISQEPDTWRYLPAKSVELPPKIKVGVAAVNASNAVFAAEFSELTVFRAAPPKAEKE
jgi:regulation of enolase protein 1 (concanavalin A-like superfamily)